MLLGVDFHVLGKVLHKNPSVMHNEGVEEPLVDTTKSQARKEKEGQVPKEADLGTEPNPLEPPVSGSTDEIAVHNVAGNAEDTVREFDFAEMFINKLVKEKQSRKGYSDVLMGWRV